MQHSPAAGLQVLLDKLRRRCWLVLSLGSDWAPLLKWNQLTNRQEVNVKHIPAQNHFPHISSHVTDTFLLFHAPFAHEKTVCISTSGSMVCHLFICYTIPEQNPHIITSGIENTVNINFVVINTVKADVIAAYNKAIIALYIRNRR